MDAGSATLRGAAHAWPSAKRKYQTLWFDPFSWSLLQTPNREGGAAISPNGKWMAYHSNETGRYEIYVRPFPKLETKKWQISTGGGIAPLWGPDGQELFYSIENKAMMTVQIGTETDFAPGVPEILFEGEYVLSTPRDYDITPDGQRFIMIKRNSEAEDSTPPDKLIIVPNRLQNL